MGLDGRSWRKPGLVRAIPAGDVVIGVTRKVEDDTLWSTVLGMRPEDGAQLWRWHIRRGVTDVVVDPVERAVLVLMGPTMMVLDFTGHVTNVVPLSDEYVWEVVRKPTRDRRGRLLTDVFVDSPGLARIVPLQGSRDSLIWPELVIGVEVATGAIRWQAQVPAHCEVHAAVVPQSATQPIGADVLVSFGGSGSCRTLDQVTRFGPEGARWSVSLAPADAVIRSCVCRDFTIDVIGPDLFTINVDRNVHWEDDHGHELLLFDGSGQLLVTVPTVREVRRAHLLEVPGRAGPLVALADEHKRVALDLTGEQERLPVPGIFWASELAVVWPLLVEFRGHDTLVMVVRDASDGARQVEAYPLPSDDSCWRASLWPEAYGGYATVVCEDRSAIVVALPEQ